MLPESWDLLRTSVGPCQITSLIPPEVLPYGVGIEPGLPCGFLIPVSFGKAYKAFFPLLIGDPCSLLPGGNNRIHTFLLKRWPRRVAWPVC